MTHEEIVKRAEKWLKNAKRCPLVLTEVSSSIWEIPDVIGFYNSGSGQSILIECKTSMKDFYAEKNKLRFRLSGFGIGNSKYYCCPKGIIPKEKVPDPWGLLYICGKRIKIIKTPSFDKNISKNFEVAFLVSVLRRVEIFQNDNINSIIKRKRNYLV